MAVWQQDIQQQQAGSESALSLALDHLHSCIQTCRLKLSQLQHWLTQPSLCDQQEALSLELQEAEQQLVCSRQQAEECEWEVQQATQQQLAIPSIKANFAEGIDSGTAGIARTAPVSISNSTLTSSPALTGDRMDGNNDTSRNGHSIHSTGNTGRAIGTASGHTKAPVEAAHQGSAKLMHSAKRSRGRSVWQPASGTSTRAATMTPPAATLATLPPRLAFLKVLVLRDSPLQGTLCISCGAYTALLACSSSFIHT